MAARLIGVDVGGSGIKAAIVDVRRGEASGRIRVETPHPATPDAVAKTIAGLVEQFDVVGPIGCTMPAVVHEGVLETAAHIDPSWIGTDASAVFARATGRPCLVCNDADAAGFAEARFGAARDVRGLVIVVTVGTGVGTALVHDGVLVPNSELGHVSVRGRVADDWVSDATRATKNLTWKRWTRRLDEYLTYLHDLLTPDLFVIGGGIVKHRERFVDRLDPGCEVRIAELGNLAGIVGAGVLADTTTGLVVSEGDAR
jgi:polyphosphate glucokinase